MGTAVESVDMVYATIRTDADGGRMLVLAAAGKVPTSGWSAPDLVGRSCTTPPADGMWDFNFVGHPPTGIFIPVVSHIMAVAAHPAADWVRGVRVHAAAGPLAAGAIEMPAIGAADDRPRIGDPLAVDAAALGAAHDVHGPQRVIIMVHQGVEYYFLAEWRQDPCAPHPPYTVAGPSERIAHGRQICTSVAFHVAGDPTKRTGMLFEIAGGRN